MVDLHAAPRARAFLRNSLGVAVASELYPTDDSQRRYDGQRAGQVPESWTPSAAGTTV